MLFQSETLKDVVKMKIHSNLKHPKMNYFAQLKLSPNFKHSFCEMVFFSEPVSEEGDESC